MTLSNSLAHIAAKLCEQLDATLSCTLGSGAYKQAFLVALRGESLALKIAPISGDLRARFKRETEALSSCRHPAIASILHAASYEVEDGHYWVTVEEYLPGGTLAQRLQERKLQIEQTRQIALIMAAAVEHLHERDFVHRDIKPANILFRRPDEPVLTDFGIVRVLGAPSLTHDFLAQGPGTPMYAAPEQLLNEKSAIDWRTDQFGLAVVIAECVIGRHPFASGKEGPRDAIMRVANRESLPETTKSQLIEAGFGSLIKALSPWPVGRYRWPAAFIEALSKER